ncbi:unnamed protein product [Amaranthus hypochondriacus]
MHQPSRLHQFLKKLLQFVISFSMLCFLFLHPSWLHLFHTFISYFSTFSSQLISLATDKNYIFLLCNGILVFIAKYSSHTIDTRLPLLPETSPNDDLSVKAYQQSMQSSTKTVVLEEVATNNKNENRLLANAVIAEDTVEEKYVVYQITNGVVKEDVINDDEDAEYIKKKSDNWFHEELQEEEEDDEKEDEEQEQEEEEAISKMSTEELNRKFDDFIRKMKEELRIEAQQQLIVV